MGACAARAPVAEALAAAENDTNVNGIEVQSEFI